MGGPAPLWWTSDPMSGDSVIRSDFARPSYVFQLSRRFHCPAESGGGAWGGGVNGGWRLCGGEDRSRQGGSITPRHPTLKNPTITSLHSAILQ